MSQIKEVEGNYSSELFTLIKENVLNHEHVEVWNNVQEELRKIHQNELDMLDLFDKKKFKTILRDVIR